MTTDTPLEVVKIGDIIWVYDIIWDMKVPLSVVEVSDDGGWKGAITWTWGWA